MCYTHKHTHLLLQGNKQTYRRRAITINIWGKSDNNDYDVYTEGAG